MATMTTLEWVIAVSTLVMLAFLIVFGVCCGIYLTISAICAIKEKLRELKKEREIE